MSQPQRFTRDDLGKIVTANINEFGWHCVNVVEDDDHPPWSYTIGLLYVARAYKDGRPGLE
jgi:hypothetical protein